MPTLKLGNTSLLTLPTRITTPSIHIQKDGDHWYVPLFSGSAGGTATSGDYQYTLGHLIVDGKRVALSQTQSKTTFTITGSCSVRVSKSTYTTTVGQGTSQTIITHKKKSYSFSMSISSGNDYISYVTTNLAGLSASGSSYSGSWAESSTPNYPSDRDIVFAIQTKSPINGYSISNSYQNVASGNGSFSKNFTITLNGSK